MLAEVIGELFHDWPYRETGDAGLPAATIDALVDFWMDPKRQALADALGWPHMNWTEILGSFRALVQPPGSRDDWRTYAEDLPALEKEDAMAAVIAGLYPAAVWEGGGFADAESPEDEFGSGGLRAFAFPLARVLVESEAQWAARVIVNWALRRIANLGLTEFKYVFRLRDDFGRLQEMLDQQYDKYVGELAWALWESCAPSKVTFAPEVAAIAWALGDPHHATMLARRTQPPLSVIRSFVHMSLRRVPSDPFTQFVWLRMKDREPFCLREHKVMFGRLNAMYWGQYIHNFDDSLRAANLCSASDAFATAAGEHFGGGATNVAIADLRQAYLLADEHLFHRDPHSVIRLGCLLTLVAPGTEQQSLDMWRHQCDVATQVLAQAELVGLQADSDRSLDVPFAFLDPSAGTSPVAAMLERVRSAALWAVLNAEGLARATLEDRTSTDLRLELPSLRFAQLRQRAPMLARPLIAVRDFSGPDWDLPDEELFLDDDAVRDRIVEIHDALEASGAANAVADNIATFASALHLPDLAGGPGAAAP